MYTELHWILDDLSMVFSMLERRILETSPQHIAAGSAWPPHIKSVDQGSRSTVAEMVAQLRTIGIRCEHIPSSQRGRTSSVNCGIERVTIHFVAVTDEDCFAEARLAPEYGHYLHEHSNRRGNVPVRFRQVLVGGALSAR